MGKEVEPESVEIELPYPPSVNHYWRHVGRRTLISRSGRVFRNTVATLCRLLRLPRFNGPVAVEVLLYPPDRRRRDIDNALKSLCDGLTYGGVYADDSQIDDLRVTRCECCPGGKAVVTVRSLA